MTDTMTISRSDEDWKAALDCATSVFESYPYQPQLFNAKERRAMIDDILQHAVGLLSARAPSPSQGLREALEEVRKQLFALCEETEEKYREVGQRDLEGKEGAFARGRCIEAKSVRNAMGEIFRALLSSPPEPAPTKDGWVQVDEAHPLPDDLKDGDEIELGPWGRTVYLDNYWPSWRKSIRAYRRRSAGVRP